MIDDKMEASLARKAEVDEIGDKLLVLLTEQHPGHELSYMLSRMLGRANAELVLKTPTEHQMRVMNLSHGMQYMQ